LRFPRIEERKSHKRVVESEQVHRVDRRTARGDLLIHGAERDLRRGTTALGCVTGSRVIDEHTPHHPRGNGKELSATLPRRVVLTVETQPRLVHERGGLECVTSAFAAQGAAGLAAQFLIDDSRERIGRVHVTGTPRAQKLGYLVQAAFTSQTAWLTGAVCGR
jgi:hypothetical protein